MICIAEKLICSLCLAAGFVVITMKITPLLS